MFTAVLGDAAKTALAATRFADVRWVRETGSTNADLLELARQGGPEGTVLVADHQSAGRGRAGRTWVAPSESSLLVSILLRPPPAVAGLTTMALGLAAADGIEQVAGFRPRLKWPNDLVWPGDGTAADRKLAGILAEAHWPTTGEVAVVAGIGINVNWRDRAPAELAELAVSIDEIAGQWVDREPLLVAIVEHLEHRYDALGTEGLLDAWRADSATLGTRVRVDLGRETVEGTAVDITEHGHLLVDDRVVAVGDVVHLRPA